MAHLSKLIINFFFFSLKQFSIIDWIFFFFEIYILFTVLILFTFYSIWKVFLTNLLRRSEDNFKVNNIKREKIPRNDFIIDRGNDRRRLRWTVARVTFSIRNDIFFPKPFCLNVPFGKIKRKASDFIYLLKIVFLSGKRPIEFFSSFFPPLWPELTYINRSGFRSPLRCFCSIC